MEFEPKKIVVAISFTISGVALADDIPQFEEIVIAAPQWPSNAEIGLGGSNLDEKALRQMRLSTSDTAALLEGVPGVSVWGSGGVSGLPVIHGLADDRLRISVDGMSSISACANHMNPPLSYIDPSKVKEVDIMAGITPVSKGGDSIGGTIAVETQASTFASPAEGALQHGDITAFARSNGNAKGGNISYSIANEHASLTYAGSTVTADDYQAGGGATVKSTLYKAENHLLKFATNNSSRQIELSAGAQRIPYQGFVNARMDMTDNSSDSLNARYHQQFGWGRIDAGVYHRDTRHEMNFIAPDKTGNMPMSTDSNDRGYSIVAEFPLSVRDTLKVGNELQRFTLDDWWPPVSGSMMMGPNVFWNIKDGRRDRLGTFIEWSADWSPQWMTMLGVRNDVVDMNAGHVQPYNNMNVAEVAAADAFNARINQRKDTNFDLTALTRLTSSETATYEFGYAMKTRSPNLYERYTWNDVSQMAMNMNGWFGDANGYAGDINLKPEVAHTLSATAAWHDSRNEIWDVKLTPYYTKVRNYIGVNKIGDQATAGFVNLRFANHAAEIYGVDAMARRQFAESAGMGRFAVSGIAGYVRGKNLDSGDNLHHMMPLNARLVLEHKLNAWENIVEWRLASAKREIEATRNELTTSGYSLVALRTSYQWKSVRLDASVENLFDKLYDLPLGGTDWADYKAYGHAVPGMGRSINVGVTVSL